MKKFEHEFCMKHFKVTIAVLLLLIVMVVGWTAWHCGSGPRRELEIALAAAPTPTAPPVDVNAKMLHPYWGNCSKCHVTTGAGKPVSKVMAAGPISVKAKMPHKYWGNCLMCHKVIDGVQPTGNTGQPPAMAAALNKINAQTLGLKLQSVTAALMQQLGLINEDGVLVLDVQPNSVAAQAGLQKGDEILRLDKTRVESVGDFEAALAGLKPGSTVKLAIFRGKKRNLNMKIPDALPETMPLNPAQIGVLSPAAPQNQGQPAQTQLGPNTRLVVANPNFGKVAVGAMGPGLNYPVSGQFGGSPYFVIFDPAQNTTSTVSNPNTRGSAGQDVLTGQYMVDLGVNQVIAGNFSPDAVVTLRGLRVSIYPGVTGSVKSVLSAYAAGQLNPMSAGSNPPLTSPVGMLPNPGAGRNTQTLF